MKGHDGHAVQEVADTLARTVAEMGRVDEEFLEETVSGLGVVEI